MKDVTPLLTHWSYVFLALNHQHDNECNNAVTNIEQQTTHNSPYQVSYGVSVVSTSEKLCHIMMALHHCIIMASHYIHHFVHAPWCESIPVSSEYSAGLLSILKAGILKWALWHPVLGSAEAPAESLWSQLDGAMAVQCKFTYYMVDFLHIMRMSWLVNAFHISGLLWGESIDHRMWVIGEAMMLM